MRAFHADPAKSPYATPIITIGATTLGTQEFDNTAQESDRNIHHKLAPNDDRLATIIQRVSYPNLSHRYPTIGSKIPATK